MTEEKTFTLEEVAAIVKEIVNQKPTRRRFYNPADIQKLTGKSHKIVLEWFNRPDFPAIINGKSFIVAEDAWERWSSQRHTDRDFKN